jgi:hypothetical protein
MSINLAAPNDGHFQPHNVYESIYHNSEGSNEMVIPEITRPDASTVDFEDENAMMNFNQQMQIWSLKMTTITNTMKTEHEGRMAVARNLK